MHAVQAGDDRPVLDMGGWEMKAYYLDHGKENAVVKKKEDGSLLKLKFLPISWENYEGLSEEAEPIGETDVQRIIDTFETAEKAHAGQTDKAGKPYIHHPLRVSQLVKGGVDEILTALLHDVAEDTEITLDDLRTLGYSDSVVNAVDCMSQREGEARKDYLNRLKPNETARRVKLADLTHNSDISRIKDPQEKDFRRVENYKREMEFLSRED